MNKYRNPLLGCNLILRRAAAQFILGIDPFDQLRVAKQGNELSAVCPFQNKMSEFDAHKLQEGV